MAHTHRRILSVALALVVVLLLFFAFSSTALAETQLTIDFLGCDIIVPDGWGMNEVTAKDDIGETPFFSFTYPEGADISVQSILIFQDLIHNPNARVNIGSIYTNTSQWVENTRSLVEGLNDSADIEIVSSFSYWQGGRPVKGGVFTFTFEEKAWIFMFCYLPSVNDTMVMTTYKTPADGSVDTAWFLDVIEAQFPEMAGLGLSPKTDASGATVEIPEPTAPPPPDITTLSPQDVIALKPQEFWSFFVEAPEETYLRLGEANGLSLVPLVEWAKAYGLGEPKAAKDGTLSFPVAKGRGNEWNGLKKVEAPVPADAWLDQKGLRISMEGMCAVSSALSDAWTKPESAEDVDMVGDPHELGRLFAENPKSAYLQLAEVSGLPLAPVIEWAKTQGLDKPAVAKDGAISFPVAKKRGDEWGGQKKVSVPIPSEAWLNQKGLLISPEGLGTLVSALAEAWTEPQADSAGAEATITILLMAEEEMHEAFPNFSWEYTETQLYVTNYADGQEEAHDDTIRTVIKQCAEGYYEERETISPQGGNRFSGEYVPFGDEFYYWLSATYSEDGLLSGRTAYANELTDETRERYSQRAHPFAAVTRLGPGSIRELTIVEQGVDVAGRSTTRYSYINAFMGSLDDIWVDDEFGIVLKSVSVNPNYGSLGTFETTSITFGDVTLDSICDLNQYNIDE